MINFDYYRDEILRIVNMEEQIAVHKEEPCECSVLHDCRNCEFDCNEYETTETCDMKVVKWLCSEHKEKPKITEFERGFLVAVEKGYIARDKNKELWITCIYADRCKAIKEKVTEIKQSGVVEKVYRDHVNGWCVTVKCGRNKHTYIMLKDRPKVKPGDMVKIGENLN